MPENGATDPNARIPGLPGEQPDPTPAPESQPDPTGPGTPNAQPEGSEASGGGPIPGTMTTYGKQEAMEHIRRMGHRADVAPEPAPAPAPEPVHDLPVAYLTPDGYAVTQDLRATYERYKSGNPRACVERLLDRIETGLKAFEQQPFAEDPLGDAPFEG